MYSEMYTEWNIHFSSMEVENSISDQYDRGKFS